MVNSQVFAQEESKTSQKAPVVLVQDEIDQSEVQNGITDNDDQGPQILIHNVESKSTIEADNISTKTIMFDEGQNGERAEELQQAASLNHQNMGFEPQAPLDLSFLDESPSPNIIVHQVLTEKSLPENVEKVSLENNTKDFTDSSKQQKSKKLSDLRQNISQDNESEVIKRPNTVVESSMKTQRAVFKIKKIKQERASCTDYRKLSNRSVLKPRPLQVSKANRSNSKGETSQLQPNRKLLKNLSSVTVSGAKKGYRMSKFREKENQNISYEFQMKGKMEMMSQILEDKHYYPGNYHKSAAGQQGSLGSSQQPQVRKIVKRSPYGFLQIEVKPNKAKKSAPQIKNLRILKPKQASKLQKISKNKSGLIRMDLKLTNKNIFPTEDAVY